MISIIIQKSIFDVLEHQKWSKEKFISYFKKQTDTVHFDELCSLYNYITPIGSIANIAYQMQFLSLKYDFI